MISLEDFYSVGTFVVILTVVAMVDIEETVFLTVESLTSEML